MKITVHHTGTDKITLCEDITSADHFENDVEGCSILGITEAAQLALDLLLIVAKDNAELAKDACEAVEIALLEADPEWHKFAGLK